VRAGVAEQYCKLGYIAEGVALRSPAVLLQEGIAKSTAVILFGTDCGGGREVINSLPETT
jgi:hypothetical protein